MIAGPNGSGKSTLIEQLRLGGFDLGEYLNADDIAKHLSGSAQETAAAAQQEVRVKRHAAVRDRRDHAFETVLSHPSHVEHLKLAKSAGFAVNVYFVATDDPLINIGRVASRVRHGGHDVPRDRIEARYHRSIANLKLALAVADQAAVFDNSYSDKPLRLLAIMLGGQITQIIGEEDAPLWWQELLPQILPSTR
ncbi:MAG: AAA family ATPase [Novosphingobium sp.]|uniref:AAA family ATPase n=1 Tax=Novosphingobium sp. TaxID=1874826 RepID=UPI0030168F3E